MARTPKICKIKQTYRGGYLKKVTNPCGKKQPVYIYQGRKPGFSAAYSKSSKEVKGSSPNAERYAKQLAKKGHKTVTFRD